MRAITSTLSLLAKSAYFQGRMKLNLSWFEFGDTRVHAFWKSKIVCDFWRRTYSSQNRNVVCLFAFMLDTRKKPILKPSLWAQEFAHTVKIRFIRSSVFPYCSCNCKKKKTEWRHTESTFHRSISSSPGKATPHREIRFCCRSVPSRSNTYQPNVREEPRLDPYSGAQVTVLENCSLFR